MSLQLRRLIGDFATLITVFIMSCYGCYYRNEVNISYLHIPTSFAPAESSRTVWMVKTLGSNEIWVILLSVIPAVVLTLMLFLEHGMTTLIANRKENKLKVHLTSRQGLDHNFIIRALSLCVSFDIFAPTHTHHTHTPHTTHHTNTDTNTNTNTHHL